MEHAARHLERLVSISRDKIGPWIRNKRNGQDNSKELFLILGLES
jgi:hypothetical protein